MSTVIQESISQESINSHERGFRTVLGCVAIAVLMSEFVSTEVEIFAISLLTVYAMITAIVGVDPILDPIYAKVAGVWRRLKGAGDDRGTAGGSRHSFA